MYFTNKNDKPNFRLENKPTTTWGSRVQLLFFTSHSKPVRLYFQNMFKSTWIQSNIVFETIYIIVLEMSLETSFLEYYFETEG